MEDSLYYNLSFSICWDLNCGLMYGPVKTSPLYLRKTCILLLIRVPCMFVLEWIDLLCCSNPLFSCLSSVWLFYSFVNIRMSRLVKNFLEEFIWLQQWVYLEAKSQQTEKIPLLRMTALQFIHLELRRELKGDYMEVGGSEVGQPFCRGGGVLNEITAPLRRGALLPGGLPRGCSGLTKGRYASCVGRWAGFRSISYMPGVWLPCTPWLVTSTPCEVPVCRIYYGAPLSAHVLLRAEDWSL